jgi:hypothetical protein
MRQVSAEEAANAKQRLAQQRDKHLSRQEALAKTKGTTETKARNIDCVSLADLRAAAQARRVAAE